jgi:protein involved in polysaccharide export with SLBB domain
MLPGARRLLRAGWRCALAGALVVAGCRASSPNVDRNLMSSRNQGQLTAGRTEHYTVTCPDMLELTIAGHPELSGPHPIGVDGRLDLDPAGRPRVEGETVDEITQQLAEFVGVPADDLQVRITEYHAESIFLFGEVIGLQRAVPYQGQETVIDLLRRTGGITAGAAPRECYVVRPHVGDTKRPEVFHVDLEAIVVKHDERTNVRLQPFDQVHVAGTMQAGWEKCVPPWLRPLYERLCGWWPSSGENRNPKSEIRNKSE